MTVVQGQRSTGNVLQDNRKIDMAEKIRLLEPHEAPLTMLSRRLSTMPTVNPEFSWLEDEHKARFDAVDTTTGRGTTVRVDNADKFSVGDTVYVSRTGELILVTAIASPDLTVTRGIGGSAIDLADDDELIIVGRAHPEGDGAPAARSLNPVKIKNYTQIYRNSFDSTGTLMASEMNTRPGDWAYNARKAGVEHNKDQEYTRWFGKPSESLRGGRNGQPLRTTGGVFHFVQTNVTDVGGLLTEADFWTWASRAFRYGSKNKILFCSRLVTNALNDFPRAKVEVPNAAREYGIDIVTLISPHGRINVVTFDLFEGTWAGGVGALLDMNEIKRRVLAANGERRDTHIRTNIQAPDVDGRKDEYLTEDGLEFGCERYHAVLEGVTGSDITPDLTVNVTIEEVVEAAP